MKARILFLLGCLCWLNSAAEQIPGISAETLKRWQDSGRAMMILDVRGREAYQQATLSGAINGGKDPAGFLPGSSRDPVILIIPEKVDISFILSWVKRLQSTQQDVRVLTGGIKEWIAQGGAVVQPKNIYTKPGTVPFLIPKGLCEGSEPAQSFK